MPDSETLLHTLEDLRRDCESAIRDHTGGATMCQVHKDGHVTGGLKYEEGRLVVFSNLIRRVKRLQSDDDPDTLMIFLDTETDKWQQQLARYQADERPAITWVAYSQGGVDALESVRQILQQTQSET